MVRRAARAVGITRTTPAASSASSMGVAMASISGTTRSGFLGLDQRAQLRRVAHGDGAGVVRHLLAGGVVVAVHRDGFHAQALQRDQHFLAQFAGCPAA
jgi:hypothetical protein